jgi:FKBP-type peptidyl-prolyl cis-trans isomerase
MVFGSSTFCQEKIKMKRVTVLALTLMLVASAAQAQQSTTTTTTTTTRRRPAAARTDAAIADQLNQLKQSIDAQQEQIRQLSRQIQRRDQQVQELQQKLDQSQAATSQAASKADAAASQSSEQQQDVTALRGDVTDLKNNTTNSALALQETQKLIHDAESPVALHYKGITITPGGFLAAESVWRAHALGADINTPFNSIPMPGADVEKLSEFFGSGRQSRVSMLTEGKLNNAKLTGYVEADFLSAGITSNNNQSNSYSMRQRQVWGQAALNNGLSFTGGQMWSLVTETKKGLDNRTEAVTMTIDPQYNVGFSWARQYGFRVVKNFDNKFWLGASVENAQAIFSASGNAQNFVLGSAGTGGGLYNASATYSFNPSPDFIFKAAAEPGFGHFEVFGVVRRFRDRVYPGATATTPTAAGAYDFSTTATGVGANARVSILKKHVDVGGHFLGGDGMGRYGSSGLPDVTVNPNGTLALLRSAQGLGTLEFHAAKFDVYFNAGAEFVGRHYQFNSAGKTVGYGSPTANNIGCYTEGVPGTPTGGQLPTSSGGFLPSNPANCTANTRNVIEGTTGFWYRFYKGPKGTLQVGPQYSYFMRNSWEACGTSALLGPCGNSHLTAPHGNENIFETSFRYYLP